MKYLLLLLTFLLTTTISQQIAFAQNHSKTFYKQDIECLKFFGIKKLFFFTKFDDFNQLPTLLNSTKSILPILSDARILMTTSVSSPSTLLTRFKTYVNSSMYDIVWLQQPSEYEAKLDCNYLRTYVYYCSSYGMKCGFQFSGNQWEKIFPDDRLACPEAAALPLLYTGGVDNWKPMGGWRSYKYALTSNMITFCTSGSYTLYQIVKEGKGERMEEIERNWNQLINGKYLKHN